MANKSVLNVFFEGLKIYSLNIHKFILYMSFPVLGQILGIYLIFGSNYWFTNNLHNLSMKFPAFNNMSTMILLVVLAAVPGFVILLKAFWEFLVAYGALNSMTDGYLNTGKVYDFKSHKQVVLNRSFSFIALWMLFGIFTFISIIPIFWVIGAILFVYFVLIFQIFTFESGLSPVGYFKRSFNIIKGNFVRTFMLIVLLFILTYLILPAGLSVIFDYLNWTANLSSAFEAWAFTLPIEPVEKFGVTPSVIGNLITSQFVFIIMAGFTLPLRSICFTLWYSNLAEPVEVQKPKKSRKQSKQAKTFKIEKREIDPEIIRRARLEDDEY